MNCEQIEVWVSALQDGELDVPRRRAVEEHLACCRECRALSDEWEALAREMRAELAWDEVPQTLHGRVMRQIPPPKPARPAPAGFGRPSGRFKLSLAPISAVLAWLLLVPHPARPIRPSRGGDKPAVLATAPERSPSGLSGGASSPTSLPRPQPISDRKREIHDRATRPPHPRETPAGATVHSAREPHRSYAETEMRRLMRQLRPPRRRYPLALSPFRAETWRRRHRREFLAFRPEKRDERPRGPGRDAWPHITVVDYVLPEVPAQLPASDEETEFVMHPAEPAPAADPGVSL